MASAAEQLAANMNIGSFARAKDLHARLWFTLGALKAIEAAGGSVTQQRIEAEARAAARVEKRNAAKGKAPAPKAPRGDANKISARTTRTAAKK